MLSSRPQISFALRIGSAVEKGFDQLIAVTGQLNDRSPRFVIRAQILRTKVVAHRFAKGGAGLLGKDLPRNEYQIPAPIAGKYLTQLRKPHQKLLCYRFQLSGALYMENKALRRLL